MKRHQIQTCKGQEQKDDIVGDIINKVDRRAEMDIKPMFKKTPPKNSVAEVVPIEAVNAIKPKSLTDLLVEIEGNSDSEDSDESTYESEHMETDQSTSENESDDNEFMADNPTQLMKASRKLYEKLQHNLETYNNLLEEMHRMNCLSKECNSLNEHLQKKMGI